MGGHDGVWVGRKGISRSRVSERQIMADTLDIEALESQMNEAVEEIVSLQKEFLKKAEEIEAKKEHVNKLDGAIWALKMERENAQSQTSDGIPEVATTADN